MSDSIYSNVDIDFIAKQTKMEIKAVKAYTATKEEFGARYPEKNFLDVVANHLEPENDNKVLLLGGGSVDISNLDTIDNPNENIATFREKTIVSAQKMFCLAESAIHDFPALRKVILMKRIPRIDPVGNDPLSLKQQLSKLADSVYFGLWCDSTYKDQIFLGEPDIPIRNYQEQCLIFGPPDDDSFDGIHLRGQDGRKVLTQTIQSNLKKIGLIRGNLPDYINNQKTKQKITERKDVGGNYHPFEILKQDMKMRKDNPLKS